MLDGWDCRAWTCVEVLCITLWVVIIDWLYFRFSTQRLRCHHARLNSFHLLLLFFVEIEQELLDWTNSLCSRCFLLSLRLQRLLDLARSSLVFVVVKETGAQSSRVSDEGWVQHCSSLGLILAFSHHTEGLRTCWRPVQAGGGSWLRQLIPA